MSKVYRVLIPMGQPQANRELITVGAAVARHQKGEAVALNILLHSQHDTDHLNPEELGALIDEQNRLLAESCRHTRELGIAVIPVTLLSSGVQDAIIRETRNRGANLIVMGWNKPPQTPGAIMGNILDSVTVKSPADVAILRNRGLTGRKILLSTAGGPESHLGGQIAVALQHSLNATVTLLHLVRKKEEMDKGRAVLEEFAKKYGLKARRIIKARDDFTVGILEESRFHDLIIIGGSRVGAFSKIFSRTIPEKVVEQAECSVLVTHRQGPLPLMTRFFGYRSP